MKIRTALLWSIMNNEAHESLKNKEKTIAGSMPLVEALFPGINYYSITGFGQVMRDCLLPVLKKRYPELLTTPVDKVKPEETTDVVTALPSNGYEWKNSAKWQSKFKKLLAAA